MNRDTLVFLLKEQFNAFNSMITYGVII